MIDAEGPIPVAIGIDPGVDTGLAVWSPFTGRLILVKTMRIHQAMVRVRDIYLTATKDFQHPSLVIFEDARKRRFFGSRDANQEKYGAGVREGAGSVKRDCSIWEDYLTDEGIPFIAQGPKAGTTKYKSPHFKALTKWEEPTNVHGRDAAMLVYGMNMPQIKSLLRFNQPK